MDTFNDINRYLETLSLEELVNAAPPPHARPRGSATVPSRDSARQDLRALGVTPLGDLLDEFIENLLS